MKKRMTQQESDIPIDLAAPADGRSLGLACAGYLGHPFSENGEFFGWMPQVASTAILFDFR